MGTESEPSASSGENRTPLFPEAEEASRKMTVPLDNSFVNGDKASSGSANSVELKDITPTVPLALRELRKLTVSGKVALPHLVTIGKSFHMPGMKYAEFAKRMKTTLGDMWGRFKDLMLKVWNELRSKAAEDREKSLLIKRADTGQTAFYKTSEMLEDFLDKHNRGRTYAEPQGENAKRKLAALYNLKRAILYHDDEAVIKFTRLYREHGGTFQGLQQSVRMIHPLSAIPDYLKGEFMNSLNAGQMKTVDRAVDWYRRVYGGRVSSIGFAEYGGNKQDPSSNSLFLSRPTCNL